MTIRKLYRPSLWFQFLFLSVMGMFVFTVFVPAEDAEEWMPDPALREAIREKLRIPADSPLTQAYVQEHLTGLHVSGKGIVNLTGLEHATDLQSLGLARNKIQDLSPLSGLTGLVFLNLGNNQISDLRPLAALTRLEVLHLWGNQIEDISPLTGLVNLKDLNLSNNQITDLSPLVGLPNLENLNILLNEKGVLSTIPISKLLQFGYDEACDLEGEPISERIEDRKYPSIFSAWGNIINLPSLSFRERMAYHDLHWSGLLFQMKWLPTPEGLRTYLPVDHAKEEWDDMLSRNQKMIFIVAIGYQAANLGEYPEDWPYWLRDESGNIIFDGVDGANPRIDFTYPKYQDYIVRQVIEFAKCGLFDGVFLDWWRDEWHVEEPNHRYHAYNVGEAAITMLRRIREGVNEVRDDFLIIANTVRSKVPRSAPYINGIFMETTPPYSYTDLVEIENTLLWAEQNLQEPRINCLEGYADKREPPDSPRNQQWMRLFTTMSLTHSDGYVNFVVGGLHEHHWYPFYDVDLVDPSGGDETKGQPYINRDGETIDGLFIREFTNGWAVYNRSGKAQEISLPGQTTGVESGITSFKHTVPDLDGEMFLKTGVTADVNGDGVVNILDLVLVANAFGKAEPDLNGDGVVNILDLVVVANAF